MESLYFCRKFIALGLLVGLSLSRPAQAADHKDVLYARRGEHQLLLDIYGAKPGAELPGLVMIHGGAWVEGSKADWKDAAPLFAKKMVCFAVNYRLVKGKENLYPAQLDDVQLAVRWIRSHAKEYGLDPNRLGAIGGSAGGHLASMLGTTDTRDNSEPGLTAFSSRVNCVVNMAGPSDFTPILPPMQADMKELAIPVKVALGGGPEEVRWKYLAASPIVYVDKKTAPHLLLHGEADTLVPPSQARKMQARLEREGIRSTLVVYEKQGHGFDTVTLLRAVNECMKFLKAELKVE